MTGIEILAEYTVGGFPDWVAMLVFVVAVIGTLLLMCGICAENEAAAAIGLVALLSFIVVGIAVEVVTEPKHTRYKVTICDDVKLVEFLEQYEILDTEGEIYTIREVIPDA